MSNKLYGDNVGHGWQWKNMMVKIGLPPERCHSYATLKRRGTTRDVPCPRCGKTATIGKTVQRRILEGRRYFFTCHHIQLTNELIGVINENRS